jgi:hypothetical protein
MMSSSFVLNMLSLLFLAAVVAFTDIDIAYGFDFGHLRGFVYILH